MTTSQTNNNLTSSEIIAIRVMALSRQALVTLKIDVEIDAATLLANGDETGAKKFRELANSIGSKLNPQEKK